MDGRELVRLPLNLAGQRFGAPQRSGPMTVLPRPVNLIFMAFIFSFIPFLLDFLKTPQTANKSHDYKICPYHNQVSLGKEIPR